jgi:hypothetical protein
LEASILEVALRELAANKNSVLEIGAWMGKKQKQKKKPKNQYIREEHNRTSTLT